LQARRHLMDLGGGIRMASADSILVVDDDPAVCEAITSALASHYQVQAASTASAALDALCAKPFDLILLDHRLPDLSGTDVLRLVKRFFSSTIVILITGFGSEDIAVDAFRGGARDYLRKPIDCRELQARVALLLELRRGTERRLNPFVQTTELPASGGPNGDDPETTDRARAIFRAIRHIEAHLDATLSLADVARVAGMSKFHFCRRFQAHTGQHFREFLARRRIERAKELLKTQGRTITDIFRDVGFKDMTHFGRVFKRLEGQLPSEFRRGQKPAEQ
jgi:YesN/AraC family two-component response regulator